LAAPVYQSTRIHIHFRQVVEAVVTTSDAIVTHQSVGGLEFQLAEYVFHRLEEGFVGYHPSEASGGEESPTVVFRKTLGSIVTEIELSEIPGVVVIGYTSRNPHVAARQ